MSICKNKWWVLRLTIVITMPLVITVPVHADAEAEFWLERAESAIASLEDPASRAESYERIAGLWNRLGTYDQAQRLIEKIEDAAAESEDPSDASRADRVRVGIVRTRIRLLAEQGKVEEAETLIDRIDEEALPISRDSAHRTLAHAQAVAGDVNGALATAARLEGRDRDRLLGNIAQTLTRLEQLDAARRVVGQIDVERSPSAWRWRWQGIAGAHARAGEVEAARTIADDTLAGHWRDRIAIYRELATAQAEAGRIKDALATAEATPLYPEPRRPSDPKPERGRLMALSAAGWERADQADFAGAEQFADRMTGHWKASLLGHIVRRMCEEGEVDAARELALRIKEVEPAAGAPARHTAIATVAVALIEVERVTEALDLAAEHPDKRNLLGQSIRRAIDAERLDTATALQDHYEQRYARVGLAHRLREDIARLAARLEGDAAVNEQVAELERLIEEATEERPIQQARLELFKIYLERDAIDAAREQVRRLPEGLTRGAAMRRMPEQVTSENVERVNLIVAQFPPGARADMIRRVSERYREMADPAVVADWLDELPWAEARAEAFYWLALHAVTAWQSEREAEAIR